MHAFENELSVMAKRTGLGWPLLGIDLMDFQLVMARENKVILCLHGFWKVYAFTLRLLY